MKQALIVVLTLIAATYGLSSCNEAPANKKNEAVLIPPSSLRIEQICQSYQNRDYSSFLAFTHNYKEKQSQFKEQLVYMLQQQDKERVQDSLIITDITANRVVMNKWGKSADVYLDVTYNSSEKEEIILPLIYDQGKWWIK